MLSQTKSGSEKDTETGVLLKKKIRVGTIVHTRVPPDLAVAIEAVLTLGSDGLEEETITDFVRAALWNEAMRRGQTRPPPPTGLPDLAKKIDRLAEQIQSLSNNSRLQHACLQSISAELEIPNR